MILLRRIFSNRGIIRSKLAWLLVVLCVVTVLVLVRWPKETRKESIKTASVEEAQEEVVAKVAVEEQETLREDPLPEKWPQKEPEEVEMDVVMTLQGVVTNSDPCIQLLTVEGFDFDTGPLDVSGIRAGDVVKAHYVEKRLGRRKTNVLKSVEFIAASEQSTAQRVIPQREEAPFRAVAEQEENEEFMEEEPLPEPEKTLATRELAGKERFNGQHKEIAGPESTQEGRPEGEKEFAEAEEEMLEEEEQETDVTNTMAGRVTACDHCFQLITVGGLDFDGGRLDVSGIRPGDYVEIAYTEKPSGKVIKSIVVIESNH
ncbi:MAG: hypothetical protein SWH78_02575 [Thermodesulfobacteriota bacterium]|nr:hypothetical protein [Thermodesulfobacteriota bacterium]